MPFHSIIGHQRPIKWLQTAVHTNHLGHAYLFHGEPAIGKRYTAMALTQFLHCEHPTLDPTPDACGTCRSCHQVEQAIHPDCLIIQPEDTQKSNPKIKIDQIRAIEPLVIYRPLVGSHKVCLIDDADTMTTEASNALLKTLEDPPDHCLFLLISSRPEHLLPTIRSRCLALRFSPLPVNAIEEFLGKHKAMDAGDAKLVSTFSEGRLGQALHLDPEELKVKLRQYWALLFGEQHASATQIFDISESLVKSNQVPEAIYWFQQGLRDVLLLALDESSNPMLYCDQEPALRQLAQQMTPAAIIALSQELNQLERGQQRNLNMQIGLDQFFFHLQDHLDYAQTHE
ncbi:MAG: DNA polymerase III subunit delta' [Nitrospirota bacterium]|nr:DNA polymerase III subunit delta' [Nitrospirota bacterium]MDH5587937.1 DNA polymerase III subunit delta' [Nitrospirota bacterium]MDH5775481.1 DNA polymerase III subunit delta' [Nitrospirota bacterium]